MNQTDPSTAFDRTLGMLPIVVIALHGGCQAHAQRHSASTGAHAFGPPEPSAAQSAQAPRVTNSAPPSEAAPEMPKPSGAIEQELLQTYVPAARTPSSEAPPERDSGSGPSETDPARALAMLRANYEMGMNALKQNDRRRASGYFLDVQLAARDLDKGGGLFVQRPDGHWTYRQDEISELYALAAYRSARIVAEHSRPEPGDEHDPAFWRDVETSALELLCTAIEARPDVVRRQAQKDQPLSLRTKRILDRAQRRCFTKGGWRSTTTERPDLGSWNDPIN